MIDMEYFNIVDSTMMLGVIGTLITVILGVVAFFLKKIYDRFEKLCDKVDLLTNTISVEQNKHENLTLRVSNCERAIQTLDTDFDNIDKRVAIIEKEFT